MENSVDIFNKLHSQWLKKLFVMFGFNTEQLVKHSATAFILLAISISIVLAQFYTIICYYNNLELLLKCFCLVGIAFQVNHI